MKNLAIFASGFGSNFKAIQEAIDHKELDARIAILISDQPLCVAVKRAKKYNIDVFSFHPKDYASKEDYEFEILEELKKHQVDLVILAGYMRIIGRVLLKGFQSKIINIHPSLLPDFKGKDAVGQAIKANVKCTGVTVHYVNEELDSGQIIAQETLDISEMKSRLEIEENIHKIEHKLYPQTIRKVLEDLNEKSNH